jgi:hypothetical protein
MSINEECRVIKEFDDYEVTNLGNVYNINSAERLRGKIDKDGYIELHLKKDGKGYYRRIHRLVAMAFIPNPENKPMVDHIDGNKKNNKKENLRWCTATENSHNTGKNIRNTSGVKGVKYLVKHNVWVADIKVDGISVRIGTFKTKEDAAQARINKANEVFGEFTHKSEKQ